MYISYVMLRVVFFSRYLLLYSKIFFFLLCRVSCIVYRVSCVVVCFQGRLTTRRKKELERKKKHRLFHFVEKMKEGVIVRRHLAHQTCDQIVLQSAVSYRSYISSFVVLLSVVLL